jgi:chaperone modulatory protein CbpM
MTTKILTGVILDEHVHLSLQEICVACSSQTEWIVELVEEGVLQPLAEERDQWRFPASSLARARSAVRLRRDLGLNPPGVALALDLLEEIEELKRQIRMHPAIHG